MATNWNSYKDKKGPAVKTSTYINIFLIKIFSYNLIFSVNNNNNNTNTNNKEEEDKKYVKQEAELLDMGFESFLVKYALHLKKGDLVSRIFLEFSS